MLRGSPNTTRPSRPPHSGGLPSRNSAESVGSWSRSRGDGPVMRNVNSTPNLARLGNGPAQRRSWQDISSSPEPDEWGLIDKGRGRDKSPAMTAGGGGGYCGGVKTKACALLCVVGLVFVGGRSWSSQRGDPSDPPKSGGGSKIKLRGQIRGPYATAIGNSQPIHSVHSAYCSAPLQYPLQDGQHLALAREKMELKLLQVTIRHGDRSAIHSIKGSTRSYWSCHPFSEEVEAVWAGVHRYTVVGTDGQPLNRTLRPQLLQGGDEGVEGRTGLCAPGQLTEYGLRQHLELGASMREAYRDMLGGGFADDEIYVRSTDYTRTLQSAAAFLFGLLPDAKSIKLLTNTVESEEVMHGVGIKTTGNLPGGGEKTYEGTCKRAVSLSHRQQEEFRLRKDVGEQLEDLFGTEESQRKIMDLTDNVHARVCHNMSLPCSDQGCVTPTLARSMMAESDRGLCFRYVGAHGGMAATSLAFYPFLRELLANMKAAATGSKPLRFALYSGHDTVVAPVLAALGAYDCAWPPYASHVAIELWQEKAGGKGGGNSTAAAPESYFRLTYNGRPVTHFVHDCRGLGDSGPFGKEFCRLNLLERTVLRAIKPAKHLREACQEDGKDPP